MAMLYDRTEHPDVYLYKHNAEIGDLETPYKASYDRKNEKQFTTISGCVITYWIKSRIPDTTKKARLSCVTWFI